MVGDYTLLTRLGEGGMGVVHLAQRPGGDRVALKVLRPQVVGDDEARARLAREVNSLSRVRSRRVAEIVDADPWADVPYVATRYVPGLCLHDQVRQEGPITGADLVWFASCLAEALAAVHEVGVLHRDIKPSNVVMEGRTPILIDFGLARVADDPRLTHTGWLLGTPGYLAPEILHGQDATPASDVHSFAATVAFAGLGRGPFGRGPSMAVMDRVRRGEHDLAGLDPVLRAAVEEALDPEPALRPSLPELREWLASLGPEPAGRRRDDPATVPLLLPDDPPPASRPPGALERLRGSVLTVGLGALAAAGVALAPYLAVGVLVVLAWLLRSGSMAVGAVGERRRLRGPRWYDAPRLLLATPWHLVAAVPGTLLLALWSVGIAAAAGLLCFAAALSLPTSLGVVGFAFALGIWWGPGSRRVRSPVRRVGGLLAARPVPWFLSAVLAFALATGVGSFAASAGPNWTPDDARPFADVELPGFLQP